MQYPVVDQTLCWTVYLKESKRRFALNCRTWRNLTGLLITQKIICFVYAATHIQTVLPVLLIQLIIIFLQNKVNSIENCAYRGRGHNRMHLVSGVAFNCHLIWIAYEFGERQSKCQTWFRRYEPQNGNASKTLHF